MKTCFKCGIEKDLDEFYKHPGMLDGRLGKCKECTKLDVRKNYRSNLDYYRDYDKLRDLRPSRISDKAKAIKKFRGRYPEKYRAHNMVNNAIRNGKLKKGPCEMCGDLKSEGHHEDYSKPLEVRWLCGECHKKRHGRYLEKT